jgi:hypothetical protein
MSSLTSLDQAIQFIQQVEQTYPNASPYEIANRLRGHTKAAYTTQFWSIATGFKQDFVFPNLDGTIDLAGEITDFGHMIAALSDQINQPGLKISDLTQWTADHTSWAGDIGSAIVTYCRNRKQFGSVRDALDRFASDCDHAANVAAHVIGARLNQSPDRKISAVLQEYATEHFDSHVRSFQMLRFGEGDPAPQVRRQVLNYLKLAADSGLWGTVKGWFRGNTVPQVAYSEAEINQGIAHFLDYLRRKSQVMVWPPH